MEQLKQMKKALIECVESQVYGGLKEVDAKELGEAMDMIKDLSEAIYYCTITEAMEKEEPKYGNTRAMYYMPDYNPPYYAKGGGIRGYHDKMIPYRIEDYEMIKDPEEGRSGWRRKMYMNGKHQQHDKTKQMQELEAYMMELTRDMTEMIEDASPEEKALL